MNQRKSIENCNRFFKLIINAYIFLESSEPILYGYWRSSCTWRCRIALNLKQVPFEVRVVNLLKKEHIDLTYTQLNPIGQVPTFRLNDKYITQSMAIMEFIEEHYKYRGHRLLPDCKFEKANVRKICEIINSGIQPVQNLSVGIKLKAFIKEATDGR